MFFLDLMRSKPSDCFDVQQVHYLPKLSIGEVFSKRQLAFYAFCVTDVAMKEPKFYTWLECEGLRGAEEIASGLIHALNVDKSKWSQNISKIRLFCDGYAGQNKNQHVVHALSL